MAGWIKLHRQLLDWEWYDDVNTKVLFIHLLLKANIEDKEWHGMTIKRGQLVTSIKKLSTETGITEKKIRNSLDKLKRTNEVSVKGQTKFSLITIENYTFFQGDNTPKGRTKGEQLGKQRATTKELNKKKEKASATTFTSGGCQEPKSKAYQPYEPADWEKDESYGIEIPEELKKRIGGI